jgi:hypothetical protein
MQAAQWPGKQIQEKLADLNRPNGNKDNHDKLNLKVSDQKEMEDLIRNEGV